MTANFQFGLVYCLIIMPVDFILLVIIDLDDFSDYVMQRIAGGL